MIELVDIATVFSGSLVGFILGLIGGGGSILAVPLLVYVVGVDSPHIAIGTSAIAVALSALANLVNHAKRGNVRWPCGALFSIAGILGATLGSSLGKSVDGQKLLFAFGALMLAVAATMLLRKPIADDQFKPLCADNARWLAPRLLGMGAAVGAVSGFFGIGGGFLIVPGLMMAARMPMLLAIGTSLVAVSAFGLTTAASYAISGLVDWRIAALFVAGGLVGGALGARLAMALGAQKSVLTKIFAGVVAIVGLYMIVRGAGALWM